VAEAQQKIADLQKASDPRNIQEAQDNITKATYDLADAQKELDRAQRRGNTREIELATIALRDAQNSLLDSQTELTDANKAADPQALIDAQEDLTTAELDAEEARLALIDATDAITTAQTLLNEAINGAAEGTEAYNAALELLNTAREEEAAAAQAVVDAIDREREAREKVTEAIEKEAEAKRDLAEAEKELNALRGTLTPAQIAAAQAATGINAPALDFSGVDFEALGRLMRASGRANGGSVMAGTPYIVGERGQELFVPSANGTIIPNHEMSQGGTNIIVNVSGSVITEKNLIEQIRIGLLKSQKSGRAMVL
jgi:chromosome segregation ATPase